MGLVKLEKVSNVTRDLFSEYDYAQKYTQFMHNNIPESDDAIFQDGGHFQHKNHFIDSLI